MHPLRKICEHCGFDNHSRVHNCTKCGKTIAPKGEPFIQKSMTPEFKKRFHSEVDKIRYGRMKK